MATPRARSEPRAGRRVPQRGDDGEDVLHARRPQRRTGRARHRRRLEGGRVARLRLRIPAERRSASRSCATTSRSSRGCSRRGGPRTPASTPTSSTRSTSRRASSNRVSRSWSAATAPRSPGAWPRASRDELNLDALRRATSEQALPVIAAEVRRDRARPVDAARVGAPLGRGVRGAGHSPSSAAAAVHGPRPGSGDPPGLRRGPGPAGARCDHGRLRGPGIAGERGHELTRADGRARTRPDSQAADSAVASMRNSAARDGAEARASRTAPAAERPSPPVLANASGARP